MSNELTFGNLGVGKLSPKGVEDAADPTTGPVATLDRQSPATSKGIGHQSTLRFLSHVLGPNLRCCYQRKGEANWCSPLEAGQERSDQIDSTPVQMPSYASNLLARWCVRQRIRFGLGGKS